LLRHPSVMAVAVLGMPDERLGEVGWAFVVADPSRELTEDGLIAWARDNMANYKAPRRVIFKDSLPLNPTGKVDKLALRSEAKRGAK